MLVMLSSSAAGGSSLTDGSEPQTDSGGPPVYFDYRNFTEIRQMLLAIESSHAEIAKVFDIGDSWEKTAGVPGGSRDILAMKISDRVAVEENEPEVLIMALHHAREWPTVEIATALIENLTSSYGTDPRLSWLVDNREIWVVPVVNPDGYDYSLAYDDMWRKNRRDNLDGTFGVDLNRNYNGSENGDPLGAWGGAGSSNVTSNDVYCGAFPFSEPETQAIRDLARAHSFQIAFDVHAYGELVCWPWGYTTNLTEDDVDFVRIGSELAALNGYTPQQSADMYLTTGDSLDWLYGSLDIYSILFEVGNEFSPELYDDVVGIVAENVPPLLLGIEIAGDREERKFNISHIAEPQREYSIDGFALDAIITADRGVNESFAHLVYRVDGGAWSVLPLEKISGNDSYGAVVPAQGIGSVVEYYFVAADESGVQKMSPAYAPYNLYSFEVTVSDLPPIADAGPDQQVMEGSIVSFDGSGSTDDFGIVNYTWTFDDGAPRELYGVSPKHTFSTVGSFVVTLTVKDGTGQLDQDDVTVEVVDATDPFADAGDDIYVKTGTKITFDGSLSHDNVAIVNYTWSFVYDGLDVELYGIQAEFWFNLSGSYTVTLTVVDAEGNSGTDTVLVIAEDEEIPEFSLILVPILVTALLVMLTRRFSRAGPP